MTRLFTVKELEDILRIKKTKAYSLCNTPGFPVIKIGGTYLIPEDELDEWLHKYVGREFRFGN